MPKVKRFTARKPRNQSYSTNPETARIREIEQSRVGLAAEIARINTKYRTRLSRKKAKMHKTSEWKRLSENERIQRERQLKKEFDVEEEKEWKMAAEEWKKLMDMKEQIDEEQSDEQSMNDSEESWKGIDDDDDNVINKNENEESDDDSQFEEGNIDAPEIEDLFDENGNKITMENLAEGLKQIYTRHMRRLAKTMKKYQAIDDEDK